MSEKVSVLEIGEHEYGVTVTEGAETTHHRVVMPEELRDDLLPLGGDEARVVREAVDYLLDREPSDSLPAVLDLNAVRHEDAAFLPEMQTRLAG